MRPLFLTPENKEKALVVLSFAERPENWFHSPGSSRVPGDRAEFTVVIDTFRCVYTHTVSNGRHFRHLSISVPAVGKMPHPISVFTLATFFGFTGAEMAKDVATDHGDDWMLDMNDGERCIVVAQETPR